MMATEDRPEWVNRVGFTGVFRLAWRGDSDDVCIFDGGGMLVATYHKQAVMHKLDAGSWIPCDRPADAIAPRYCLVAESLYPEWIVDFAGASRRLCWSDDGKVSSYGQEGFLVVYSADFARSRLLKKAWREIERPADAVAPNYRLTESPIAEEKPLRPEWIVEDYIFARLCWSEANDFDGKKFVPVKLVGGDGGQYIVSVIEQNLKTGAWRKADRPKDAIAPAYGLKDAPASTKNESVAVGDMFTYGSLESYHAKECNRLRIESIDDHRMVSYSFHNGHVCSSPILLENLVANIKSGYWRRLPKQTNETGGKLSARRDESALAFLERRLAVSERKHAELLTLVEALLAKHDPGMLAAIRKSHGSSDSTDKP